MTCRTMMWKTREGQLIKVSDLGDSHLANIVAFLKREGWVHTETAMACLAYACSTGGEMASMAAEAEFHEMKTSRLSDAVFEEFARRTGEGI